ncbi:MAG: hypothetical protein CMJ83_07335, partial [Planctomycetes bacterium]|nr:hypothetical protein [Planctomycetota bacterium]
GALASVATADARALAVHGLHVLIADGSAGLTVVDVTDRTAPSVAATVDLNGPDPQPNDARHLAMMPHYHNPPPSGPKTFDMYCYVADGAAGVRAVHVGNISSPSLVATLPTTDANAVWAKSHYVAGSSTEASIEKEFLFVADGAGGLLTADITLPFLPVVVSTRSTPAPLLDVFVANSFEPPLNRQLVYAAAGGAGLLIFDASSVASPWLARAIPGTISGGLDLERIALDRLVDEDGVQIKDVSHEGARTFNRAEIERILGQ